MTENLKEKTELKKHTASWLKFSMEHKLKRCGGVGTAGYRHDGARSDIMVFRHPTQWETMMGLVVYFFSWFVLFFIIFKTEHKERVEVRIVNYDMFYLLFVLRACICVP